MQGTSVGFTDRYPAFFHGQNVEITHVPPGDYVLVHRANPNLYLRELRYEKQRGVSPHPDRPQRRETDGGSFTALRVERALLRAGRGRARRP